MKNDNENGLENELDDNYDELDLLIISAVKKAAIKDILKDEEKRIQRRKKVLIIAIIASIIACCIVFICNIVWAKVVMIIITISLIILKFTRYRY